MICIHDLHKLYHQNEENETEILHGISLEIKKGDFLAVMGKSGSGKSTLLHILACISPWEHGEYLFRGISVKDLSERQLAALRCEQMGIVMQHFALAEDFTVLDNVRMPLDFSRRRIRQKQELALAALERVGLRDLFDRPVSSLSGGEKQRTAIARAIVRRPQVIFADEPTGALDSQNARQIMDLLHELNREGITIVMVTHDHSLARECSRIVTLCDGRLL